MTLDELERDFRDRTAREGAPTVILALQVRESDVRSLRPWLVDRQMSLSEYVRALLLENRRRYVDGAMLADLEAA